MDHDQVEPGVPDEQLADDVPLATVVAPPGVTRYRSRPAAWVLMWTGFAVIVVSAFLPVTARDNVTFFGMFRLLLRQREFQVVQAPAFFVAVMATVPVLLRYRNTYALTAVFRMLHLLILIPLLLAISTDLRDMGLGMYALAAGWLVLWISTLVPRVPVPDSSQGFAVDMTRSGGALSEEA